MNELDPRRRAQHTGAEPIHADGFPLGPTIGSFWQWAFSDVVTNTTRGILAEYLVACDLGVAHGIRGVWENFDLITATGITVEVKSTAYLQSWKQRALSRLEWTIGPTKAWNAETMESAVTSQRQAQVYVFALLHVTDKALLDPLNVSQWTFYVVPTTVFDTHHPTQKKISHAVLRRLPHREARFGGIAAAIGEIVARGAEPASM